MVVVVVCETNAPTSGLLSSLIRVQLTCSARSCRLFEKIVDALGTTVSHTKWALQARGVDGEDDVANMVRYCALSVLWRSP